MKEKTVSVLASGVIKGTHYAIWITDYYPKKQYALYYEPTKKEIKRGFNSLKEALEYFEGHQQWG